MQTQLRCAARVHHQASDACGLRTAISLVLLSTAIYVAPHPWHLIGVIYLVVSHDPIFFLPKKSDIRLLLVQGLPRTAPPAQKLDLGFT